MPGTIVRVFLCWLAIGLVANTFAAVDDGQSQDFYEDAIERYRSKNYSAASVQLRNTLQKNPQNLAARILFGKVLLHLGQPHAAIKELTRAQSMGGDGNLYIVPLAKAYLSIAQPGEVVSRFNVENYTGAVAGELSLIIAESHQLLGEREAARKAFSDARRFLTLDPRPLLGLTRRALGEGKPIKAEKLLRTALLLGADSGDAWLLKGIMHRDSRQFEQAEEAFAKALAADENSARALTARAAMWMDVGDIAQARADLGKALGQGSASLEMIYLNALLLFQEGKADEARESLRAKAKEIEDIRTDVRHMLPKTQLMLGVVAYFEKRHDEAVKYLRRFLADAPGHHAARRYLAGAYLGLEEYAKVIELYQPDSSAPAPADPLALALLAEAYRATGDFAQAEKHIANAHRIGPALARVGVRVAMDRLSDGRTSKAIVYLEKLAAGFPGLVEIHAQLARGYVKSGRVNDAQRVVDRLLKHLPDDAQVRIFIRLDCAFSKEAGQCARTFSRRARHRLRTDSSASESGAA
ncbi:MAG: putative PEP-CTERM system TPR-repeat lipoprotein [Gammaproteobacteria bacterium]|jgi:putative PEP-CTERM system TPR-repeat lipoprotein